MTHIPLPDMNSMESMAGGARHLYNDLHQDQQSETLDLLQMIPENERQQQRFQQPQSILKQTRPNNVIPDPPPRGMSSMSATSPSENDSVDSRNYNTMTSDSKSLRSFYSDPAQQNSLVMAPLLGSNNNHSINSKTLPASIGNETYYQQQHPILTDHPHLCQKHARQLENNANAIYDRHPGYGGTTNSLLNRSEGNIIDHNDPYYGKVHTLYKDMGKDKTDNGYFNYLKDFRRKGNAKEHSRSTQSLPAVTYTFNNKSNSKKGIFRKTSNLFKSSNSYKSTSNKSRNNNNNLQNPHEQKNGQHHVLSSMGKSTNTTYSATLYKQERDELLDKDADYGGIKRLLIVVCILVGVILALGGIVIGFIVLPNKLKTEPEQCSDGYLYCAGVGCTPLSRLCDDPDFTCSGDDYTKALAMCIEQENSEINTSLTTSPEPYLVAGRPPSVMSTLVYDDSEWVHYVNSTGGESMYYVVDKIMPFSAAQEECRLFNGHLAHVTDIREQVFLEDYLKDIYQKSSFLATAQGVWLGARRMRGSNRHNCMEHKQWRWVDVYGRKFGHIDGFSSFGNGKPDDYYSPEECLYIKTKTVTIDGEQDDGFLKWDDAPCDDLIIRGLRPLCEVELRHYNKHVT